MISRCFVDCQYEGSCVIQQMLASLLSGRQRTAEPTSQLRDTNGKKETIENNKTAVYYHFKMNSTQILYRKITIEIWPESISFDKINQRPAKKLE